MRRYKVDASLALFLFPDELSSPDTALCKSPLREPDDFRSANWICPVAAAAENGSGSRTGRRRTNLVKWVTICRRGVKSSLEGVVLCGPKPYGQAFSRFPDTCNALLRLFKKSLRGFNIRR